MRVNHAYIPARTRRGLAAAAALILGLVLSAGCSKTPILATIETEVPLASPTIRNNVQDLFAAMPDGASKYLYASNGNLYRKGATITGWERLSLPNANYRVADIATDRTDGTGSLYALFVSQSDWSVYKDVMKFDGTNWTSVTGLASGSTVSKIGSGNGRIYAFSFTGTNADKTYAIYDITSSGSAASFGSAPLLTGIYNPLDTAGDYVISRTKVYFWNGSALAEITALASGATVAGNTKGENISVACDATGMGYVLTSGYVYETDGTGSSITPIKHSVSTPANCVSILDTAGTDYILVSGLSGYCEIPGTVGGTWATASQVPGSTTPSTIPTTAQAQYLGNFATLCVKSIWGVTDPVPSGESYAVYGSVLDDTLDGLWAHYPATRATWNREN